MSQETGANAPETNKAEGNSEVKELKKIVLQQSELIKEQGAKIEALEAKLNPSPKKEEKKLETPKDKFKVNGKNYVFTLPKFYVPNRGKVLAVDALKDQVILEQLVLSKSQIIKQVK